MLKWTVINKRIANEKTELLRHPTIEIGTTKLEDDKTEKPKRRRSTTSRRSSTHRSTNRNRRSLNIDQNKENRFTSTPIKSDEHIQLDVLRDVSNITPKDGVQRRVISANKSVNEDNKLKDRLYSPKHVKHKKKKRCLDPTHSQEFFFGCKSNKLESNYFRPFEAVDSHIVSVNDYQCGCRNEHKFSTQNLQNIKDTYAPTLPTFAMEYSPCALTTTHNLLTLNYKSPSRVPPIFSHIKTGLKYDQLCPPNKKAKIDHVNDFLHQISFMTSPENKMKFPGLNSDINQRLRRDEIKVSPLVKRFVDLKFSQISSNSGRKSLDDSSYINDLSLDKLVDVILDNSPKLKENTDNTSIIVNFDTEMRLQDKENELNETHEDNLINMEHERQSFSDKNSIDSGFRSTNTEQSHNIDLNFMCKCNNNKVQCKSDDKLCDKTIINLDETFNERCVDVEINGRKRASSSSNDSVGGKRLFLDDCQNDIAFTLRRQKCIRRRKLHDSEGIKTGLDKIPCDENEINDCQILSSSSEMDDNYLNDNSFDSSLYDRINEQIDFNMAEEEIKSPGNDIDLHETPNTNDVLRNIRRTRRCLLFDSPRNNGSISSLSSRQRITGSMDIDIEHNSDALIVNVMRCNDLTRANGKPINAYVKVSLSERVGDGRRKQQGTLQRTAVQAESSKPTFNHTFKLPLQKTDLHKRLYIEVWHRDRICRRSEFLGCMSFGVRNAIKKNINGSFRLLPQSTGRCQNAPITTDHTYSSEYRTYEDTETTIKMCESQSSAEEIIAIDDIDNDLRKSTCKTVLSEQQKLADENLFLRYLELDPTEGPEAIPAALQRKATGNKNGRTPFTTTKKLTRQPKTGFGFSVVWTHPPRIERVEKGLPADKAGILPGDYIIFVDKHNVVMMPEIDILNLIRSYGNQLTLEIFRRNASRNGSLPSVRRLVGAGTGSTTGLPAPSLSTQRRPSTVCSTTNTTSVDYNRRRLQLPQVTFSAEKPTNSQEEARKKAMYQLVSKEQQYATGLQFAITRFVSSLAERKDLITPTEHRILFQNSDELLRITEDILDNLVPEDGDPQLHLLARTYHSKVGEIISAYKKYCSGIKKSDCVLANKTKNSNSDFVRFLQVPAIPRRRPDITAFIHKPLEHYRDVLKLFNVILSNMKANDDDYPVISQIVHDLQITYREITSEGGLMEPLGEGRPLLSVQDLENRLVFTKCKPFVLSKPGRQWIFGGDLSRVEGRNVRQYWTLLFSDILLFAKVSRDRVLFIFEDPIPLAHITDLMFNVRKKVNEFRITVEPGGVPASSPTVHCGPDLSRTPRKNPNRKCVVLRAPTTELKAVWQNLLQRQIFHVNAGMDGSSFSSPLESPEAPITSSVATLQSAESLSLRRQTPQYVNHSENAESHKQIDELIEHKCKQLGKSNASHKGSAIHLEQWMKGQLGTGINAITPEEESEFEVWTEEMFRKRCEELQIPDGKNKNIAFRSESRCEEINISDIDRSPSRSTTSESQVTVRSSPVVPETVTVCRQCHRTCLTNQNGAPYYSNNNTDKNNFVNTKDSKANMKQLTNSNNNENEDWQPLMLMGLSAINPAASLIKFDPFATPVPQISIVPPTPDLLKKNYKNYNQFKETNCNCQNNKTQVTNEVLNNDYDISPDDSSPQTEDQPYHSLSSSNLTLRRFGTVSSLERVGSEENQDDVDSDEENSSESYEEETEKGFDNEAFNHSAIRSWTARAGSYVAEKMSFFEKLGEDYKAGSKFFERYLKTTEVQMNGDDGQEEETSGATSGEEIWGTPTSGGEMDDTLNSPNFDGRRSPNEDSLSSNGDDTEFMMDELLMTPPVTGATIRGLLPRRTLEPLMEEEYSDTYTSSSSSASESVHTEPSASPEQGNVTGNAADECSAAAENPQTIKNSEESDIPAVESQYNWIAPRIHRSDSYRHIIEAEDDNPTFFTRFKPTIKFLNIERIPRSRGVKLLEFFNVKRAERRVHESFPGNRPLLKVFSKDDYFTDEVPTAYAEKTVSPRRLKDKQLDRRFWKQLNRRRQKPLQLSA